MGDVEDMEDASGRRYEGSPEPPPPAFSWLTAFDLMSTRGPDQAVVLGLSMISEQLDYIARRLTNG